jgi:DNA-binding CsgD family transcriptional regulator
MIDGQAEAISEIYDAALEPGRWQGTVQAVVRAFDVAGGAYIVFDKLSGSVRSLGVTGPCATLKDAYIDHFAPIDPYAAVLRTTPIGTWIRVHESLSPELLRHDEWYNDFFLPSGLTDSVATRLFDDDRWLAVFGFHEMKGSGVVTRECLERWRPVHEALRKAAKLHHDLDLLGWKSTVAARALEQIAAGVVVTDARGQVIECNSAAERILRRDDGLVVRGGMLVTRRVFESSKMAKLIAAASQRQGEVNADHMLVVRLGGRAPYALTVVPLSAGLAQYERPLTMVLIADPEEHRPSQRALAEFFGFSPAESHLAAALMQGRRLGDIARERGVRITTVRSQLSSVLKKVGAERQSDLVRVLASTQLIDVDQQA